MLAERIRQARLAAGLTLTALGDLIGVSHTAVQKYEKGLLVPSSSILLKIARACKVCTEYFFRTHHIQLLKPEFRKLSTFGKKAQEALLFKVTAMMEQRIELLNAFPRPPFTPFQIPKGLKKDIQSFDELEDLANQVRTIWQLGLNPIADLTDTLEGLGLFVLVVEEDNPKFSGLTATVRTEGGAEYPIIVVSSLWPGDRQRFTLAHELGHLLLQNRLSPHLDEEKACDCFAGAFLAPKVAIEQALGKKRQALEWNELYVLKQELGLSMLGCLIRAKQCHIIAEPTYLKMMKVFSMQGWRKEEPGEALPVETPNLFLQLVYRALAEQHISESKAAELLGIPLMQLHRERLLESVHHKLR